MIDTATRRWFDALSKGLDPVLIAGTNDIVRALNVEVRQRLKDAGELSEHLGTWVGRDVSVGDQIVLRRNDYRARSIDGQLLALLNGSAATVIDRSGDGLLIRLTDSASDVAVSAAYLNSDGFDYGYALTAHRAQGGTWDVAIAVGADGLYREAGYLMMSRGRFENMLVLTQAESEAIDPDLDRHDQGIARSDEPALDSDERLSRDLGATRSKTFALTEDPYADLIANLAKGVKLSDLEAFARNARRAEGQARVIVGSTPEANAAAIDRADFVARHLAVGQSVKPVDRNNIGTVVALNDDAGTAEVGFTSAHGTTAQRTFRWDQISIIEPRQPVERAMSPDAEQSVASILAQYDGATARWNEILATHDAAPDDEHIYKRAAEVKIARAAARLSADRPDWLVRVLGDRPTAPAGAQIWDDAVTSIGAFRSRHQVTDHSTPFGPLPRHSRMIDAWEAASTELVESRLWLQEHGSIGVASVRSRTQDELLDRRDDLDAILDTAPSDHRVMIRCLLAGQISLADAPEVLEQALAGQGERRTWILEHWPHIIESMQVDQALAALPSLPAISVEPPQRTIQVARELDHGLSIDLD